MPITSALFLVIALVLAVVAGAQTHSWTWGPAMLALGVSVAAALPSFWRRAKAPTDLGMLILGFLTACWFAYRAWQSPVAEFAQADTYLLATVIGAYLCIRAIRGKPIAEQVLMWGSSLLLLANVIIIIKQISDSTYSIFFNSRAAEFPSGFYSHYNEAANYLIAASMLVGAAAVFGNNSKLTRVLWMLISVAGVTCVWFTRSRGGIFGVTIASLVFVMGALIFGKRTGARWFAPLLIALPLFGFIIMYFLFTGWEQAQAIRGATTTGISGLLDNSVRLFLLGFAISCIALHPFIGGGSRSFSWECFQFIDIKNHGQITTQSPDFIHNEIMQAATDYGLVGLILLISLIGSMVLNHSLGLFFDLQIKNPLKRSPSWGIGGIAAIVGMLVQSSFSFVFHLMPGILLLGIALGQISRGDDKLVSFWHGAIARGLLTLAAIGCVAVLVYGGIQGTRVYCVLWDSFFKKTTNFATLATIDALTKAIQIQPSLCHIQRRAEVYQTITMTAPETQKKIFYELASKDYSESRRLYPYSPSLAVNNANILSALNRNSEAEISFIDAIKLQYGMEIGFKSHFYYSLHLLKKWQLAQLSPQKETALKDIESASEQIELSVKEMHWPVADNFRPRVTIHESLGIAYEESGDFAGAMKSYQFASNLDLGNRVNYRLAMLSMKIAKAAWYERRPSEALESFVAAKNHFNLVNEFPQGASQSQKIEHLAYLDQAIRFLQSAKVELPATKPTSNDD
jgi:tetratricopeptide (TPR) repeat protein